MLRAMMSLVGVACLLILCSAAQSPPIPLFHGCVDANATALPYCDEKLSHSARVDDIIGRLSIDEKINLLSPHDAPHYCGCHASPVPRIGLPSWKWLQEINTMEGGCTGNSSTRCSTVFIGPTGMAASFNRTSWWLKGDATSTQIRVHNNQADGLTALSGFGPNINTVKDPRYGRNSELPGECPFLSGSYAVQYLHGMQQMGSDGNLKMLAYVKHYTAYNKEASRFTWVANVTYFDMWDSYLPQYEMAFKEGKASGAMCSYFSANGVPSCGSEFLMNDVVRTRWGRPDAVFMSDCSAVANFLKNGYASTKSDASAKALNAGLDVYGGWGDKLWTDGYLHDAINAGQTSVAVLDKAVRRTLMQKMSVGVFDRLDEQSWTRLGAKDLNTTRVQQIAYEAGLQGIVLLKNDPVAGKPALPLAAGLHLAVVGPMAVETTGLVSDYAHWSSPVAPPSIADSLTAANKGGVTTVEIGVNVSDPKTDRIAAALTAVKSSEATVLVLGQTRVQEHEGMDRADTKLPGIQLEFAQQVLKAAAGKPVIIVFCSGGILSFDSLVSPASALISAFNPVDHGTRALADTLLGGFNKWGKLPVTIYPEAYTAELDAAGAGIANYEFAKGPGRGYRYYKGQALFPFGYGLSYTTFSHSCDPKPQVSASGAMSLHCSVVNTGMVDGDEVLMVYHAVGDSIRIKLNTTHPIPIRNLVQFDRVTLKPKESVSVNFELPRSSLGITTLNGTKVVYPGTHHITISRGVGSGDVILTIKL